jgi:hypothetical protein
MNQDVDDAVETLVFGPVIALCIGVLFYMVAQFYLILKPMGTSGPFAGAYNALGVSLSASYSLFQVASSIETWVAVVVILLAVYGIFSSLVGSGGRGFSRR